METLANNHPNPLKVVLKSLIIILALFSATTVMAQKDEAEILAIEVKAWKLTQMQHEILDFDTEQFVQMFKLNLRYMNKMNEVCKRGRSDKRLKALSKINDQKEIEMRYVLKKEQLITYFTLKAELLAHLESQHT